MTPAEERAKQIWQSNRRLSPADRMKLIDCEACGGTGEINAVDNQGEVQRQVDCLVCAGLGSVEVYDATVSAVFGAMAEQ